MANEGRGKQAQISETGLGALRPGTLQLVIEEGISADSCHALLDRVFQLHGCPACGLAGLDVRWRVQEKILSDRFADIPGLRDVAIYR